jgi:hypothetical protein
VIRAGSDVGGGGFLGEGHRLSPGRTDLTLGCGFCGFGEQDCGKRARGLCGIEGGEFPGECSRASADVGCAAFLFLAQQVLESPNLCRSGCDARVLFVGPIDSLHRHGEA